MRADRQEKGRKEGCIRMWTTRTRREERIYMLQCIAFGTACMAVLLGMMIFL